MLDLLLFARASKGACIEVSSGQHGRKKSYPSHRRRNRKFGAEAFS